MMERKVTSIPLEIPSKALHLCIAGSREHDPSFDEIHQAIEWTGLRPTTIVTGGCRGVDEKAKEWAIDAGYVHVEMNADWKRHGKRAGPLRNAQMAEHCEALLVVGPTTGRGTQSCMEEFVKRGKPVYCAEGRCMVVV